MLVHGKNLFNLGTLNNRYSGYYIAADGTVWSTRASSKRLVQLNGSYTSGYRYFTLGGASVRYDRLLAMAKVNGTFAKETMPVEAQGKMFVKPSPPSQVLPFLNLPDRVHAKTLDEAIQGRGSIIAMVEEGNLVFSKKPVIHMTEASLKSEMTRLAAAKPGVKYVALKISAAVAAKELAWS